MSNDFCGKDTTVSTPPSPSPPSRTRLHALACVRAHSHTCARNRTYLHMNAAHAHNRTQAATHYGADAAIGLARYTIPHPATCACATCARAHALPHMCARTHMHVRTRSRVQCVRAHVCTCPIAPSQVSQPPPHNLRCVGGPGMRVRVHTSASVCARMRSLAYARACVRARTCACVRACVRAWLL